MGCCKENFLISAKLYHYLIFWRSSRSVRVFLKMDDLNSSRIFWSNPISLLELNLDKRLGNEEPTHPFIKKAHLKKCYVYVNVAYFHFWDKVFFLCKNSMAFDQDEVPNWKNILMLADTSKLIMFAFQIGIP